MQDIPPINMQGIQRIPPPFPYLKHLQAIDPSLQPLPNH